MGLRALVSAGIVGIVCCSPPEAPTPSGMPRGHPTSLALSDEPPGYPAVHPPFPVVEYVGDGPVLTTPRIVTITFASEDERLRAHFERFGDTITSTSWWTAVSRGYCAPPDSEHCVGPGIGGGHVVLPAEPKREYTDSSRQPAPSSIRSFIRAHVASGTFPEPTAQPIYVIYFPLGVTIEVDQRRRSCRFFRGYHSFLEIEPRGEKAPVRTAYVVLPSCGRSKELTITASHEIIETAVNPYPDERPAYFMRDPAWLEVTRGQGEVATLCVNTAPHQEGDFIVQRSWNNLDAHEGHSPCAPSAEGEVYFNAAPERQITALAVGESQTLEVVAYSDAPMEPWTLSAANLSPEQRTLGFSFDETTVRNGTVVHLTVTLNEAPPHHGLAHFYVLSTAGSKANAWLASVRPRPRP
jgi:hypothetical protein